VTAVESDLLRRQAYLVNTGLISTGYWAIGGVQ
jgi:hypothetical protein